MYNILYTYCIHISVLLHSAISPMYQYSTLDAYCTCRCHPVYWKTQSHLLRISLLPLISFKQLAFLLSLAAINTPTTQQTYKSLHPHKFIPLTYSDKPFRIDFTSLINNFPLARYLASLSHSQISTRIIYSVIHMRTFHRSFFEHTQPTISSVLVCGRTPPNSQCAIFSLGP